MSAGDDAIPLRRFVDDVREHFNVRRREEGQPPLARVEIVGRWRWRLATWQARRKLRGRSLKQFEAFHLYLPYLLTVKTFDNTETRRLLAGRVPYPPIQSYLRKVADYAVTREWGRRVSWDPALLESGVWKDSGVRKPQRTAHENGSGEETT